MSVSRAEARIGSAILPQRRNLTPAQAERRRAALSAARTLAKEGGFDAVSISAVAEKAGVSRATLYHYFGSKAQILAELSAEVSGDLTAGLRFDETSASSPEKRLGATLEQIVDWSLADPQLFEALASGWTALEGGSASVQHRFESLLRDYVTKSVGRADLERSAATVDEIANVLGHMVFSCLVRLNTGIATRDEVKSDLRLAARLLLARR